MIGVIEFDIKGLFDNIDHDLLMAGGLRKHLPKSLVFAVCGTLAASADLQRYGWLSHRRGDGGTPQGRVVQPLLQICSCIML